MATTPSVYIPNVSSVGLSLRDQININAQAGDTRANQRLQAQSNVLRVKSALENDALQREVMRQELKKSRFVLEQAMKDEASVEKLQPFINQWTKALGVPDLDIKGMTGTTTDRATAILSHLTSAKQSKASLSLGWANLQQRKRQQDLDDYIKIRTLAGSGADLIDADPLPVLVTPQGQAAAERRLQTAALNPQEAAFVALGLQQRSEDGGLRGAGFATGSWQSDFAVRIATDDLRLQLRDVNAANLDEWRAAQMQAIDAAEGQLEAKYKYDPKGSELPDGAERVRRAQEFLQARRRDVDRQVQEVGVAGQVSQRQFLPGRIMRMDGTVIHRERYNQAVREYAAAATIEAKTQIITDYKVPVDSKALNTLEKAAAKLNAAGPPAAPAGGAGAIITKVEYDALVTKHGQVKVDAMLKDKGITVAE